MRIGVEIECIANLNNFNSDEIGEYHNGRRVEGLEGWRAEEDGSLNVCDDGEDEYCDLDSWGGVEFVSKQYRGYASLKDGLEKFKTYIKEIGGDYMSSTLNFNSTTGTHIHISLDDMRFCDRALYPAFLKTRDKFKKLIRESGIRSKHEILNRYNRSYANRVLRSHRYSGEKYLEFNFDSERQGRGLEWRSPNMTGIQSWAEFDEFWGIVIDCLKSLTRYARNCTERVTEEIEIPSPSDFTSYETETILVDKIRNRRIRVENSVIPEQQEVILYDTRVAEEIEI